MFIRAGTFIRISTVSLDLDLIASKGGHVQSTG